MGQTDSMAMDFCLLGWACNYLFYGHNLKLVYLTIYIILYDLNSFKDVSMLISYTLFDASILNFDHKMNIIHLI